jgi:hypothetical protein
MWDVWWVNWLRGRFPACTSVSPENSHSTDCSTLIDYHPELVQEAKQWPAYQVHSISLHLEKSKKKLLVITVCKCSINPNTNPNGIYSHTT